jgi:hypothetical protein
MNKLLRSTFRTLAIALLFSFSANLLQGQTLMYYWNFNDNVPPTNTNWSQPIPATIGSAEITFTFTEAYSFAGTTINGIDGEVNGGSLAPRGGTDNVNNGKYFIMTASTAGYQDIILSYPTRRTTTGFTTQEIQYTIDGSTWLTKETVDISGFDNNWLASQLITINFSGISGVDDNEDFAIRIVLTGATSAAGNNRFDNIQIRGSQPGAISPPSNFSASAVSTSQINLSWALNNDSDPVLLAWSGDGVFGEPTGSYNAGNPISGGGTVIYVGSNTYFAHEDLDPASTYYYKAWSYNGSDYSSGVTAHATTDPLPAVTTLPYIENFADDLGNCYTYSVSGPTRYWIHASIGENGFAQMNGFNSGDIEEDWLILPGVNFNDYDNEVLTFDTWWRFGEDDDDNYLKLYYSTDYPGTGDPTGFTWVELDFNTAEDDQTWESSGEIDLSEIAGELVFIGFKYRYESGKYKLWQVDNISVLGDPTGIGTTKPTAQIYFGPNPTTGPVNITLPQAGSEIRVYNLVGHVIAEYKGLQKNFMLDLGSQSRGIYIIEVALPDGSTPLRSKLILQ